MKRILVGSVLATLLICCTAASTTAAPIFFTDRGAWLVAVPSVTTETYNSYNWDSSSGNVLADETSVTLNGITYSFPTGTLYGIGEVLNYDAPYHTSNYIEWQYNPAGFTITLPSPVTALGFDFGEFYGGVASWTVAFGSGETRVTTASGSYSFFGVVTDTPFASLVITADGDFPTLDNLSYGLTGPQPVPEPSSLVLLGLGLTAGVRVWRKRRA